MDFVNVSACKKKRCMSPTIKSHSPSRLCRHLSGRGLKPSLTSMVARCGFRVRTVIFDSDSKCPVAKAHVSILRVHDDHRHDVVFRRPCQNACKRESCMCESRKSYRRRERWKPQHWMERSRAPLSLTRFTCSRRSRMSCLCRSWQRRAAPQTEVDLIQEGHQPIWGQSTPVTVACCFNGCPTVLPPHPGRACQLQRP